eukprot:jgi/Tetstr1/464989/TSEL_009720.t1
MDDGSGLRHARAMLAALQRAAVARRAETQQLERSLAALDEEGVEELGGETQAGAAQQRKLRSGLTVRRRLATAQLKQLLRQRRNAPHRLGGGRAKPVPQGLRRGVEADGQQKGMPSVGAAISAPRARLIAADEALLEETERTGRPEGCQPARLRAVIGALREEEAGLDFQAQLLQEVDAAVGGSSYSHQNFAYGSTPLASWHAVFSHPTVEAAVSECLAAGKEYVVWGSSLGWLVFYGALSRGLRSAGYELLPGLVAFAEQLAAEHQVAGVRFVPGDMLACDLSSAGLVMLASQCWDAELVAAAGAKLAAELRPGALVVDYTGALVPVLGAPEAVVEVEVSWNACQAMHVFRKS